MYIWPAAVSAPYVLGAARLILSTLAFFRRLPNPFSFSARSFSTCINILCTLIYILYIYFPYNIRFLLDVVITHIRLGGVGRRRLLATVSLLSRKKRHRQFWWQLREKKYKEILFSTNGRDRIIIGTLLLLLQTQLSLFEKENTWGLQTFLYYIDGSQVLLDAVSSYVIKVGDCLCCRYFSFSNRISKPKRIERESRGGVWCR